MPPHQLHRRVLLSLPKPNRRRFPDNQFTRTAEILEDRVLLSILSLTDLPTDTDPGSIKQSSTPDLMPCCCPGCSLVLEADEFTVSAGEAAGSLPFDLDQTFLLHSDPTADLTIYLDFDGHVTTGTSWNTYRNITEIVTPAFDIDGDTSSFSNAELERIQRIWLRVVEDFAPFTVNVTTQDPGVERLRRSTIGDTQWGVRVVIGGSSSDWLGASAGGVAYVNSFSYSSDTPAFVFKSQLGNGNEKYVAEAITHEVGHTLGLSHDGRTSPSEVYYSGHGSGPTGWAPSMGNGYYRELVQWSRGDSPYPSPNNTQDDLHIITTGSSGLRYRADDVGNTPQTAQALSGSGTYFFGEGLIERNTDVDFFSFTTAGGLITIDVDPWGYSPNLDVLAKLYNAAGTLIQSSNPLTALDASISAVLAAGTYYVSVEGTGKPDDGNGDYGYSDYGSLGRYTVAVSQASAGVTVSATRDRMEEDASGTLEYIFRRSGDTTLPLTVAFTVSGTATYGTDYTQSGATSFSGTSGTITFAAGRSTAELWIDPIADSLIEPDEEIVLSLVEGVGYVPGVPSTAIVTIVNDDFQVDDAYEVNNTLETAWYLPTPELATGTEVPLSTISGLGVAMDDDWYRIDVPEGQRHLIVELIFVHAKGDLDLEIVDAEGNVFAYSYGVVDNERLDVVLPHAGSWYLHVIPYDPQPIANTYDLVWSTEVPSLVSLAVSPTMVTENGTAELVYTFSRSGGTSKEVTVQFSLGGTATFGTDYTLNGATLLNATTGTVTFAAGSSTATVRIKPIADSAIEPDETVTITLNAGINYELGTTTSATGTIQNDDFDATPNVTSVRFGYANNRWVDAGSLLTRSAQTAPWQISRIEFTFDRDVVVDAADLIATGVSGGRLGIGSFVYDAISRKATWTLSSPISMDRVSFVLDGDDATVDGNQGVHSASGTYPTGGGFLAGGDFLQRLNVLYGDVDGDGFVDLRDSLVQRIQSGTSHIWADLSADGVVDLRDALVLRVRSGTSLPPESPPIEEAGEADPAVSTSPVVATISPEPATDSPELSIEPPVLPSSDSDRQAEETLDLLRSPEEDGILPKATAPHARGLNSTVSRGMQAETGGRGPDVLVKPPSRVEFDPVDLRHPIESRETSFIVDNDDALNDSAEGRRAVGGRIPKGNLLRSQKPAAAYEQLESDQFDLLFGQKKSDEQFENLTGSDFVNLSDLLLLST